MQFGSINVIQSEYDQRMRALADALEALAPHAGDTRVEKEVLRVGQGFRQSKYSLPAADQKLRVEMDRKLQQSKSQSDKDDIMTTMVGKLKQTVRSYHEDTGLFKQREDAQRIGAETDARLLQIMASTVSSEAYE